jgi:hypothetical protein
VTQVKATLTRQSPDDPEEGGATGGVPVGVGAVGDGGNGILPPSDCNKRPQNMASSCANFSSPAAAKAMVLIAIPACKKNFIVLCFDIYTKDFVCCLVF